MRERPVTEREFVAVLKELGFKHKRTSGSHEQWEHLLFNHKRRMVSVDGHHAPFTKSLLKSMINQAGLSKKEFLKCLEHISHCEVLRKKYDPEFA
ncbi:type II toxin-antitoxin system HicA family toxin [Halomonas sp. FME1]|uniref:Type II toxin-antitoxin system HicA family toxin n=1 Tax=Halomonas casei TaxID=2742613 RepID=A0ABR9EXQ9_9GAMM|nr:MULTISPECIES: type II toxin-antitoxin system HicA family toxin [Halomonas]MBE0399008.1 type II toxin-antitoxin system HicA family toxin [Halomonas casei]PCC23006.1 hypothetical protein CIK78_13595 [Halomonas sp. JB37]